MKLEMDKAVAIAVIIACAAFSLNQVKPYVDSVAGYFSSTTPQKKGTR